MHYQLPKNNSKINNIPCILCNAGAKVSIVHYIPLLDGNGLPTGRAMKLKEGSQLYNTLIEQTGGKLPRGITVTEVKI